MSVQNKNDDQVQAGTEIPVPEHGKVADWLFNKSNFLRQLIGSGNGFLNLKFILKYLNADGTVTSTTVLPVITAKNSTVTLPLNFTSSGVVSSANVPYSGNGPPTAGTLTAGIAYLAGPVPSLYVDMTAKVLYVCTTAGTNATSAWGIIGGNIQQFTFVSDGNGVAGAGGNFLICKNSAGVQQIVQKPPKIQPSIASETITGVLYNYTYSFANGFFTRVSTAPSSGYSEAQQVVPFYLPGDIVFCLGSQALPDERYWSAI